MNTHLTWNKIQNVKKISITQTITAAFQLSLHLFILKNIYDKLSITHPFRIKQQKEK